MKTSPSRSFLAPRLRFAVLALLLLAGGLARGQAQTLLNGSFESPATTSITGSPDDWTAGGGQGAYTVSNQYGSGTTPYGSQFADLTNGESISQTVSGFTPGTTYRLSLAAADTEGASGSQMTVSVSGAANVSATYVLPARTSGSGQLPFANYTLDFTTVPGSTSVTITITNDATGRDFAVDNVQLLAGPLFPLYSFSAGSTDDNGNVVNADGIYPSAALIQARDGDFYGTASGGGTSGYGTIFQLGLGASAPVTLHSFDDDDGAFPSAALVQGRDDNLYGTTEEGGTNNVGVVYQLPIGGTFAVLHDFSGGSDGVIPVSALVQGADDSFYGTAEGGGTDSAGIVFKITAAGGTPSVVYDFTNGTDGTEPGVGVILGTDGNFYGTTRQGGTDSAGNAGEGTVFQVTPAGVLTTLYTFPSGGSDGGTPLGALVQGRDGLFYGTTRDGGTNGTGTIFKITAAGELTTLHSFGATDNSGNNADGNAPQANLIQGRDDNFYGTAFYGGVNNSGTIFAITPGGVFTTLYSFSADANSGPNNDGAHPAAGLVQASDGNFYGTTLFGGTSSHGAVFELLALPVINSTLTASGKVGVAFSYQITASNQPESFAASGLPGGLSVNADTGLISGTPKASGVFNVTISAVNADATGTATLMLTVLSATPAITSTLTASGQVGVPFSYQITATNNPTSFDAHDLPAGLSVNRTTGVISGTPKEAEMASVGLNAINAYGYASETLALSITANPPVINSALTVSTPDGVEFSYEITATQNPTSFRADGLPPGLSLDQSTGLIYGVANGSGTFRIMLFASNPYETGTATLNLTITPNPPVINSPLTVSTPEGAYFSYDITATPNPTSFMAMMLPPGLDFNPSTGVISGNPKDTGTFKIMLSASNGYATGTATLTLTITVVRPVITSPATASAAAGEAFSYQVTASNRPTRFGALGLFSGVTINAATGLITGTPTAAGTHTLTLQATNGAGTGTQTLTVTVAMAVPTITSAKTAAGSLDRVFSYQISASKSPTSYGATGLPAGLSVAASTGTITGAPTASGTFMVTLIATNATGQGTATLTLTVKDRPQINSAMTAGAKVGTAFSYQITATNQPTMYGVKGLFNGVTVNVTTGLITGTPTAVGTHALTLQATNGAGTGTQALTLTVTK